MNILKKTWVALLLILTTLLSGLAAPLGGAAPTALAAGTLIVDDDFGASGACAGAGFATIQAAIASIPAGQGGTIKVCAGNYPAQLTVNGLGKVKLVGLPGAIVTAAAPMVTAAGTTQLTIQGFAFAPSAANINDHLLMITDTSLVFASNSMEDAFESYGISVFNNTGTHSLKLTKNTLENIGSGVDIHINAGKLTTGITGNTITGVVMGITIAGGTGASISGNYLEGEDGGVVLSGTSKAKVSKNKLENFTNAILLNGSTKASISKNTVRTTGTAISIIGGSPDAGANKVTGNTLELLGTTFTGIAVTSGGAGFASNKNQITSNTITDPTAAYAGDTGIKTNAGAGVINATLIKGNKLINIATPFSFSGDTETKVSGNKCTPATPCFP